MCASGGTMGPRATSPPVVSPIQLHPDKEFSSYILEESEKALESALIEINIFIPPLLTSIPPIHRSSMST